MRTIENVTFYFMGVLFVSFFLGACSSGSSSREDDMGDDFGGAFSYDAPASSADPFEEKFGDFSFSDDFSSEPPDPILLPEAPPATGSTYVPPPPPSPAASTPPSSQRTGSFRATGASSNLGSGKFLTTTNRCPVHQSTSGSSLVHNHVNLGTRLWVEPSPDAEWVTVQRRAGPAYMRADCF